MRDLLNNNLTKHFDIIIIGAGPGGLFSAYSIVEASKEKVKILVIDKGKDLLKRDCPALRGQCVNCEVCDMISGAGGAGLFSDGKLTQDLSVGGGHLKDVLSTNEMKEIREQMADIMKKFSPIWEDFGPPKEVNISKCLKRNGLKFEARHIVHLGSSNAARFLRSFLSYLKEKGVEFLFETKVHSFSKADSGRWSIQFEKQSTEPVESDYLIVSPGKEGQHWLCALVEKMGGITTSNHIFSGIRLEINDSTARQLYSLSLDPKIRGKSGDIKTHCFCRHGAVLTLKYYGLPLLGGHSRFIEKDKEFDPEAYRNSNVAILFKNPALSAWEQAVDYMKRINAITNGNVLIQRLGDYIYDAPTSSQLLKVNSVQPSNSNATPGRFCEETLPGFRGVFLHFLERLDNCVPGFLNPDNLIYAPAIEWWSKKIKVKKSMEVKRVPGLYVVGDGSGMTLGLLQSAATAIVAARDISRKMEVF